MNFEWDENKNKLNQQKHRISFEEAGTIFNDALALSFDDPDDSINEHRMITFGVSIFAIKGSESLIFAFIYYKMEVKFKTLKGNKWRVLLA
jgi:uncharacterized DUF497 family protein